MWALPAVDPGFEISVATQGMSKGLLQSNGPQVVSRATLKSGQFQLGGQWKNISTNSAKGEASAIAGWSRRSGSFDLDLSAAYKVLTSASGSGNRSSVELSGTVGRKVGNVSLRGSAVFSPNDLGSTRQSLYVEGGPSFDLPAKFKLSANIGHRWRQRSPNYTSFNIGVSRPVLKMLTADVRLYDTDEGELGRNYERRVVGSLKLAL